MSWLVSGDTHGDFNRFKDESYTKDDNIIILGDDGCNFYDNKRDKYTKQIVANLPSTFYMVRGNHAMRPQNVEGMELVYDEAVGGEVYMESEYPNIKYFKDFGIYYIDGKSVAVIGGAYSVDKWYRIQSGWTWWEDEQLSDAERDECYKMMGWKSFDVVLSHTCPYKWRPVDKFLAQIDQSQVDTTMERFLEALEENICYRVWLFGHYHDDRIEAPHAEMFFKDTEKLDSILERWDNYEKGDKLPWWISKGPQFEMNGGVI